MPSNWLNLTRAASALRGTGLGFSAGRPPKPEPDPLREELLSPEQLVEHSRSLAHEHAVAVDGRPTLSLLRGIRESARILSLTFEGVAAAARAQEALTPAEEWLLDNFHIVEDQ